MARTIAPGTPAEPKALDIPQTPIRTKIFTDLGDDLIKASNQNFELYAKLSWQTQADKAFKGYGNDPVALTNALAKITGIVDGLPEEIQDDMKLKMYGDSISMVQKARANQRSILDKQNKVAANILAGALEKDISGRFFNVLAYDVTPEEDRREVDLDNYQLKRQELAKLAEIIDSQGNPVFNEKQRQWLLNPQNAQLKGFGDFIGRMELNTLEQWDKDYFQNKEAFKRRTGVDDDTYEQMEKLLTRQIKRLKDTKTREVHGQAWYDAAGLITNPTQANVEKAKSYDFINGKIIDKVVEASQKTTRDTWYDPVKPTSPAQFLRAFTEFGDSVNNKDFSYEGRMDALNKAADSLAELERLAKTDNLSPDLVNSIKQSVFKALTDEQAAANLQDIWPVLKEHVEQAQTPFTKVMRFFGAGETTVGVGESMQNAKDNFSIRFMGALRPYIEGDYDQFNTDVANAYRHYQKDLYGFMGITPMEWRRLESAYEEGKPAVYNWAGRDWEFQGFNNSGAMFKTKM